MASFLLERRLRSTGRRLRKLREDLALANEQLEHFTEDAEDARIRAMVSETPIASEESRVAERHSSSMLRHREDLVAAIAKLEAEQDELLDKLADSNRARGGA